MRKFVLAVISAGILTLAGCTGTVETAPASKTVKAPGCGECSCTGKGKKVSWKLDPGLVKILAVQSSRPLSEGETQHIAKCDNFWKECRRLSGICEKP